MNAYPFLSIEPLEDRIAPAVFIVSTTADSGAGSLRQAIHDANADTTSNAVDSIVFQKSANVPLHGTITLKSSLPAIDMASGDSLTINGPTPGKSNGITINGANQQIFDITGGAVTMTDLTVTHGQAPKGGGVYINDSASIHLTDITITANRAFNTVSGSTSYGGGLFVSSTSTDVMLSGSLISKNTCTGIAANATVAAGGAYGGGIFSAGTLTIDHCVVSGNVAQGGNGKSSTADVTGGGAFGGGVYTSKSAGSVTIQDSTISGNKSIGGNGGNGAANSPGGTSGYASGGGLYNYEGTLMVTNTTIAGNSAKAGKGGNGGKGSYGGDSSSSFGGGIKIGGTGATLNLQDSVVSGNTAAAQTGGKHGSNSNQSNGRNGTSGGGGVMSTASESISGTTITGNSAGYGGGIYSNEGSSTIVACTISKNASSSSGGGIGIIGTFDNATATIEDSTIASNTSGKFGGGGLDISTSGSVHIYNDTITGNKAGSSSGEGGGVFVGLGTVDVISTIISGNSAKYFPDIDGAGAQVTASYDLIQHTASNAYIDGGNNIVGVDPLLGKLAIHDGGLTATMLPAANSPVIGKGSNPASLADDQNGNSRTGADSLVDIGSVEVA